MMRFTHRLPVLIAAAFSLVVLFACSETQFLVTTAKRLSSHDDTTTSGIYKVGTPYKINGVWYYPKADYNYSETGVASWYGPDFHGKRTANGESFDQNVVSAAHRTLPLPSLVRVTNLENGRSIRVRVNDRGPFAHGRIIDLSRQASQLLGFHRKGTAKVRVEILARESRQLAAQMGAGEVQLARAGDAGTAMKPPVTAAPSATVTREPLAGAPGASNLKKGGSAAAAPGASNLKKGGSAAAAPGASNLKKGGSAAAAPGAPGGAKVPPPRAAVSRAPPPDVDATLARREPEVTRVPVEKTSMYVQAGAFADFDNANRLRARLSVLGRARVGQVQIGNQLLFRVRIGPLDDLSAADAMLERVIGAGHTNAQLIVDR